MIRRELIAGGNGIDIIKFIMSFAVITIHAPEYLWPNERNYYWLIDWIIRLAVPFFFIASGFLIQKKMDTLVNQSACREYLRTRASKLFRIWAIWLFIYVPLALWGMHDMEVSMVQLCLTYIEGILLTGHSIHAQPLWFIYSMAIIVWLWSFFVKSRAWLWILFMSFVILSLLGVYNQKYWNNEYVQDAIVWVLGGGLPITVRALLYSYRVKLQLVNNYILIITCILLSLILYIQQLPFYPAIGGGAIFLLSYYIRPQWKINYLALRKESMWIYYLHMYIIIAAMIVVRQFDLSLNRMCLLISIYIITWLIAIGITRLCLRPRFMCGWRFL